MKVKKIAPFHIRCEYTNALICTCPYGKPKWNRHGKFFYERMGTHEKQIYNEMLVKYALCTLRVMKSLTTHSRSLVSLVYDFPTDILRTEEENFRVKAEKMWKLYLESISSQRIPEFAASSMTPTSVRPTPLVFEGVQHELVLPILPERHPLSDAKRALGWSLKEMREVLGDQKTKDMLQTVVLRPKELKQIRANNGDVMSELVSVMKGTRYTLDTFKATVLEKQRAIELLQAKSDKAVAEAAEFTRKIEEERADEERQQLHAGTSAEESLSKQRKAMKVAFKRKQSRRKAKKNFNHIVKWLNLPVEASNVVSDEEETHDGEKLEGDAQQEEDTLAQVPLEENKIDMLLSVGKSALGLRIKVEWEGQWLTGSVVRCSPAQEEIEVLYEDGDKETIKKKDNIHVLILDQEIDVNKGTKRRK